MEDGNSRATQRPRRIKSKQLAIEGSCVVPPEAVCSRRGEIADNLRRENIHAKGEDVEHQDDNLCGITASANHGDGSSLQPCGGTTL